MAMANTRRRRLPAVTRVETRGECGGGDEREMSTDPATARLLAVHDFADLHDRLDIGKAGHMLT
jgi:hypothetical protein